MYSNDQERLSIILPENFTVEIDNNHDYHGKTVTLEQFFMFSKEKRSLNPLWNHS